MLFESCKYKIGILLKYFCNIKCSGLDIQVLKRYTDLIKRLITTVLVDLRKVKLIKRELEIPVIVPITTMSFGKTQLYNIFKICIISTQPL